MISYKKREIPTDASGLLAVTACSRQLVIMSINDSISSADSLNQISERLAALEKELKFGLAHPTTTSSLRMRFTTVTTMRNLKNSSLDRALGSGMSPHLHKA